MAKIDDMKKDVKVFAKLIEFSKKEKTDENILFYYDKGNMDGVFPKYIKAGSPKEINIAGELRKKLTDAFTAKNQADFEKHLKTAKTVCQGLCDQIVNRFKTTTEYLFMEARDKAEGNAAKAIKVLGISSRGKDLLVDAIAWAKIKKTAEAKKCLESLAKAEKMQEKADVILKNLASAGLI